MFETIDHIAIATPNIDAALATLEKAGPLALGERETIEAFQVEAIVVAAGDAAIELIEPTSPESAVARFLTRRGEGLHHIAYRVEDIEAALERCRAAGLKLIDEAPRPGYAGSRVAFIHPKTMLGVLTELVERPEGRRIPPYAPAR